MKVYSIIGVWYALNRVVLRGNETGLGFGYSYNVLHTVNKDWHRRLWHPNSSWRSNGQLEDISAQFPHIITPMTTISTINDSMTISVIIFEHLVVSSFHVW